ncbi:hypothetical protein ABBQ32_010386 [Trebouxia sp. C0010 RCD-2024]
MMTLGVGAVQMVSKGFEETFRSKALESSGEPLPETVEWVQAPGSRSVWVPAFDCLACLGLGKVWTGVKHSTSWYCSTVVPSGPRATCTCPPLKSRCPATCVHALCCTPFSGSYSERPTNMDVTLSYAAPELIVGMVGGCTGLRCKHLIDVGAQDVFSLGCFAVLQLTGKPIFSSKAQTLMSMLQTSAGSICSGKPAMMEQTHHLCHQMCTPC